MVCEPLPAARSTQNQTGVFLAVPARIPFRHIGSIGYAESGGLVVPQISQWCTLHYTWLKLDFRLSGYSEPLVPCAARPSTPLWLRSIAR